MSQATHTTTDIDLAAYLNFLEWETISIFPDPHRPRIKCFTMKPPEGANLQEDLLSFDKPVEVVPSQLFASRTTTVKRMHRLTD